MNSALPPQVRQIRAREVHFGSLSTGALAGAAAARSAKAEQKGDDSSCKTMLGKSEGSKEEWVHHVVPKRPF
jgi:hypothetical protein